MGRALIGEGGIDGAPRSCGSGHLWGAPYVWGRLLGLCNNAPYVVMLSAAHDILRPNQVRLRPLVATPPFPTTPSSLRPRPHPGPAPVHWPLPLLGHAPLRWQRSHCAPPHILAPPPVGLAPPLFRPRPPDLFPPPSGHAPLHWPRPVSGHAPLAETRPSTLAPPPFIWPLPLLGHAPSSDPHPPPV